MRINVSDTIRDTVVYNVCAGQTIEVNGQTYATQGWYKQRLLTSGGCDSILNINVEYYTIHDTLYLTVCSGKSLELNGYTYVNQGWYQQDLRTVKGCDSILHIFLTVDTSTSVQAYFKMTPKVISIQKMQIMFSDYSSGNAYDRKWIFHEIPDIYDDKEMLHERFTYYTPHYESDSLRVTLIVITDVGCSDTASNTYPILKGDIWVPNAFTPGADQNQQLKVGYYNIDKYEIMIYNRSGLRVYHSTNIDECWDGTHNGKPCPSATYVYRVLYSTKSRPNESYEKSGTVLLIR